MFANLDLKVSAIEGIGPKTMKLFSEQGIESILDLLVRPSHELLNIVKSISSYNDVRAWQKMAVLLQIDNINAQYAEALVTAGVKTIDSLAEYSLERLKKTFKQAKDSSLIPDTPNTEQLVNMIRDASRLSASLCLLGRIVDKEGAAMADCTIICGTQETVTNKFGFFKFGLLTGLATPVIVKNQDGKCFELKNVNLLMDSDDTNGQDFNIAKQKRIKSKLLDQYNGDLLPLRQRQRFIIDHQETDTLREKDVLIVRSFYKSSSHVKLQSIFTAFNGIEYIARTYKFPLSKLDTDIELKKQYVFRAGKFKLTGNHRSSKQTWIKLKQIKDNRPLPEKITNKTIERLLKKRIKSVLEQ